MALELRDKFRDTKVPPPNFYITRYQNPPAKDKEIRLLLNRTFVEEGYTDPLLAETLFDPREVRKRGEIILAQSLSHKLLGMIICAGASNPSFRLAKSGEAEVQLFAIDPTARGQGIASALIKASEEHARLLGLSKIVLSTQPTMKAAHKIYARHGYQRNPDRDWQRNETHFLVYEKLIQ